MVLGLPWRIDWPCPAGSDTLPSPSSLIDLTRPLFFLDDLEGEEDWNAAPAEFIWRRVDSDGVVEALNPTMGKCVDPIALPLDRQQSCSVLQMHSAINCVCKPQVWKPDRCINIGIVSS